MAKAPTFTTPGMDVPRAIRRKYTRRISVDGMKLKVELLPSLWIQAPFYGILATSPTAGSVAIMIRRPYQRATPQDFEHLVRQIRTEPCSKPGCTRRYLLGGPDNPGRVCRPHWLKDLDAEAARERAEAKARDARDDARAKAKGFRYKAVVWIHRDGDDRYLVCYFKARPGQETLQRVAARKRSLILDDFTVSRL
jgi:hypothetical protein